MTLSPNRILTVLASLALSITMSAQNVSVTGQVLDASNGEPVIGAGVLSSAFAGGATATFSPSGYAFLAAAAVTYALYFVAVDTAARDFSGVELTLAMLIALALAFAPLAIASAARSGGREAVVALLRLPFADLGFLIPLIWLSFCSAIVGFFLANVAIAKAGVNRSASFIGVATLVAVTAGTALLGESFTAMQTAAAILILAGVWIANSKSSVC